MDGRQVVVRGGGALVLCLIHLGCQQANEAVLTRRCLIHYLIQFLEESWYDGNEIKVPRI